MYVTKRFSINDVSCLADVKKPTLRIWEKRYGLFRSNRGLGNTRRYNLSDLKSILDITLLAKSGISISKLSKMDSAELVQHSYKLKEVSALENKMINQLIMYMFSGDIEQFEDLLDVSTFTWGINTTIQRIIIPFLEKVQLFSYKESTAEIHFVVTAIRKRIIIGIEKADPLIFDKKTVLLFLPQNEHYDLMLLYMAYMIKMRGLRGLYLGTNISMETLIAITSLKKPDYLFTYILDKSPFPTNRFSKFLKECLPGSKLFIVSAKSKKSDTALPNVTHLLHREVSSATEACELLAKFILT